MVKLDLLIIAYGSSADDPNDDSRFSGEDQRRIEVKLAPTVPPNIAADMDELHVWAHNIVHRATMDIKHSQNWHCEFCSRFQFANHQCRYCY